MTQASFRQKPDITVVNTGCVVVVGTQRGVSSFWALGSNDSSREAVSIYNKFAEHFSSLLVHLLAACFKAPTNIIEKLRASGKWLEQ